MVKWWVLAQTSQSGFTFDRLLLGSFLSVKLGCVLSDFLTTMLQIPRLVIPPILLILPDACCLGVRPNHTANSLGLLNITCLAFVDGR
jgi:hypothetical protein